ncbi:ATP-binding protein [Streptomyces gamaensis]|uniref:ATP-binding protein n=1 Tax=Streptomyces gamaensis TaxID=1763542 RepID=A0ABW0YTG8_9ACTN
MHEVRAELRRFLQYWGEPGRADTAELLTSELVTNALVHTDGSAVVTVTLTAGPAGPAQGLLRVEVRDFTTRQPAGAESGQGARGAQGADPWESTATSGRGLLLVDALSDGWGIRPHAVGKAVWFELGARER